MISNVDLIPHKNRKLYYFLAYFAVALGGIYFFTAQTYTKAGITLLYLLVFVLKGRKFDSFFFYISFFFVIVLFAQSVMFGGVVWYNYITFIAYSLAPAYLLLKIIGDKTPTYIVNILVVYSIISLAFWALTNVSDTFHQFISTLPARWGTDPMEGNNEQFILFTYEADTVYGIVRNPGPLNEPGNFGLILLWGLIMNLIQEKGKINKKSLILIITMLTTFSTTIYLCLIVLAGYFVFEEKRSTMSKVLFVLIAAPVFYISFFELDFMQKKIVNQYETQKYKGIESATDGRFLGAMKSIYVLQKYPFFGRGLIAGTAVNDHYSKEDASYGFIAQGAYMGIFGAVMYLILFWRGLKYYVEKFNFSKRFILFAYIALFMALFAQNYTMTPLFMILFFSSLVFKSNMKFKSRSQSLRV